jgi:predicted nucleotidyltransferase
METVASNTDLKKDFKIFENDALGIVLFGSRARQEDAERSDIDICIVRPVSSDVLTRIGRALGGKYDISVFENLPLHIQIEIIRDSQTLYGDEIELSAYFYGFRRLWADVASRVEYNRFSSVEERMLLRKRWLHAKRAILGETGTF